MLVQDLEVVTVTDASVAITWFSGSATEVDRYGFPMPEASDTELLLGEPGRPGSLRTVLHDSSPTAYHYAEVTGLEPGRTYAFAARSAGRTAVQTALQLPGTGGSTDSPGMFTTLRPAPGSHLLTVALANDAHRTTTCLPTRRSCSPRWWTTCARPTAGPTGCWWRAT